MAFCRCRPAERHMSASRSSRQPPPPLCNVKPSHLQTVQLSKGVFLLLANSRHVYLAVGPLGGPQDFGAQLELKALLLQDALEVLGNFHVDAHAAHVAQKLHCRHRGTQTLPHRALQQDRHVGDKNKQNKKTAELEPGNAHQAEVLLTSSTPITPAPMTISSSGTLFRDRAPVDDTMDSSSI